MTNYKKYIYLGPKMDLQDCRRKKRCKNRYRMICPGYIHGNCIFRHGMIEDDEEYEVYKSRIIMVVVDNHVHL
jgi:hypothetical protein